MISVVIPAYNEEFRISSTILEIYSFFREVEHEILVVSDGSTDNTVSVIEALRAKYKSLRIESYIENEGKGYAVKTGVLKAKGELILVVDADGATPIMDFDKLYSQLQYGYEVIIGSRSIKDPTINIQVKLIRHIMGKVFNFFVRLIVLPGISDTQCGFKLFTSAAAGRIFEKLNDRRFAYDVEALLIARSLGYRIREVPVNYTGVDNSKVSLIRDSVSMFLKLIIFKFRFLAGKYKNSRD